MELRMKEKISSETTMTVTARHLGRFLAAGLLTLACMPVSAHGDRDRDGAYQQTNLVADLPGVALLQDTNLVNAWGISFSPTSPFWISDNGSGQATLDAYDTTLTLHAQYKDPKAPAGYAPFNVQLLGGMVFVTYAKQDAAKHDDDAGPGRGRSEEPTSEL